MRIEHIDDVLPHVDGRADFVVARRHDCLAVDYVYAGNDTFDDPARRECRGLKFFPDGRIMARPFQKFFNIGERPETQPDRIDFAVPHAVTEKLDGSMIHPGIVEGEVVLMTRMGRTDVAVRAERHLTAERAGTLFYLMTDGLTPIFEWTAPDNRIVVPYAESRLTLLAVRQTVEGGYLPGPDIDAIAAELGLPRVREVLSQWRDARAFAEYACAVTGAEGFVVRFATGLWCKAKGEEYVARHRAKDGIALEKNALAVVLDGAVDDVLPLLSADDQYRLLAYHTEVRLGIEATAWRVAEIVASGAALDQKTFATRHLVGVDPALRSLAFQVRAGKPARETVEAAIRKSLGSGSKVDAARPLFGATWREVVAE